MEQLEQITVRVKESENRAKESELNAKSSKLNAVTSKLEAAAHATSADETSRKLTQLLCDYQRNM